LGPGCLFKEAEMRTEGLTLLELLTVLAVVALLSAVLLPNLMRARTLAQERSALGYAHNVYKAAWAYVAEGNPSLVEDPDCRDGYTAGGYRVEAPGPAVAACAVADRGDGTPQVEVRSRFGQVYRLP
ncbi:MAG: prepilin-type N-terminal cleavage/methylation domain-containing protein, partial [Thermus sp.]|uniref:prepilin-type N-terminal cleavage/methylation domain-containing protein n=1 Tax=Thermus sp. TaxID=275 RepID=UPI003099F4A8